VSRRKGNTGEQAQAEQSKPKSGGKWQLVVIALLALASVAFLAYPYISNWLYHQAQLGVVYEQAESVAQTDETDLEAELKKARDYNKRLRGGSTRVNDPFSPTKIEGIGPEEYWNLVNLRGDGVMGSVVMPRLGIETPIYHGTADEALEHGAGHVENTSLPVGGKSSHSVIAGHNGLPSVQIFDTLLRAEVGDYFVVRVLGHDFAYRVYRIDTVLPEEVESLYIEQGRDLVTLVTCSPYGINSHRLLVHGERCKVPQEWLDMQKEAAHPQSGPMGGWFFDWLPAVVGALAALVIIVVVVLVRKKRKKDKEEPPRLSS